MVEIKKFGVPLDEETKTTNVIKFGIPLDEEEKEEEKSVTRFGEPLDTEDLATLPGDMQQEDGGTTYKPDGDDEKPKYFFGDVVPNVDTPFGKSLGFAEFERTIRKGYHSSAEHLYHTLANIPGLLLTQKQEQQISLGAPIEEVANQSQLQLIAAHSFKAMKDFSKQQRKKAESHGETKTIAGKVYEGLGATPVTIAQYVSGLRAAQALNLIPKGLQFAAGFGAVDALREADQGVEASAKAFIQGATIGKYIEWAGPLAPVSRITSTGALGFALPADNAGDRIANAILFGGTSAIGSIHGERTIVERKITETIRKNRERKFIKAFEGKIDTGTKSLDKVIGEYNGLQKILKDSRKKRKDLKAKTKEDTPDKGQKIRDLDATIKETQKLIDAKATEVVSLSTILGEMEMISYRVQQEKLDTTKPTEARLNMIKIDPKTNQITRRHQDLTKNEIAKFTETYVLPPSLSLKRFPQAKYVIDLLNLYRIENEGMILKLLDDPQYAKIDKGRATKLLKSEPGENGMMYFFNKLKKSEQATLIDVMFKIERDTSILMSKKASAQKEALSKFFNEKSLEVKKSALTEKYGLNENQALAYLQVREKLVEVRDYYNSVAKAFGDGKIPEIPNIPNYIPHIFLGEYKVFIDTVGKNGTRTTKEIRTANTKFGANRIKVEALRKDPKAKVDIREADLGYKGQDMTISYFADAINHSRITGEQSLAFRKVFEDILAKKSPTIFGATKLKRKQDFMPGFAGSIKNKKQVSDFETAMNAYVEGAVKSANKIKLQNKVLTFLTEPIVDGPLFKIYKEKGLKYDSNITIAKLYPESTAYVTKLIDVALGHHTSAFTKVIAEGLSNVAAKQLTKNQINRAFGGINQITSQFYLFSYNARFLLAQGIQPYQMILPKLAYLRDLYGGSFIDPYAAMIDAVKNIARPDAFSTKVIKKAQEMFALNEKFMREFAGENLYQKQGRVSDNVAKRVLWKLSGRGLAGRVEQFSRLNAVLMFAHLMRRAGLKEKTIVDNAWYLTDNYMVRYDIFDRPMMYTEGGLGIIGKPMGLFKTFQQNYFAQMIEHVRNAKRYGDVSGLAHFVGGMILVSGTMGVVGINLADNLIKQLNRFTPLNLPTVSQYLMKNNLSDFLLFGAPSKISGMDLTATLAAPGLDNDTLFSMPGWEQAGKMTKGGFDILFRYMLSKGVQATTGKIKNAFGDESSTVPILVPPTRGEMLDAYKAFTPKLFHGALEEYFTRGTVLSFGDGPENEPMFVNKGRARLKRDFYDWYSRYFSSYSLKEAKILKTTFQLSMINKGRELTYDNLMDHAVSEIRSLPPDVAIAPWIYDLANDMGYSDQQVIKSIKRRMTNMDRDLLDNVFKGNVLGYNRELKQRDLKFILDNIDAQEMGNEEGIIPRIMREIDLK